LTLHKRIRNSLIVAFVLSIVYGLLTKSLTKYDSIIISNITISDISLSIVLICLAFVVHWGSQEFQYIQNLKNKLNINNVTNKRS